MVVLMHYKVPADKVVFQPRRINTGVTILLGNQADAKGVLENLCK
jgi:hypothetical protein